MYIYVFLNLGENLIVLAVVLVAFEGLVKVKIVFAFSLFLQQLLHP